MSFQYILRRLLLLIPTFFGITLLSFCVIQAAPGGPVENYIAKVKFSSGGGGKGDAVGGGGNRGQVTDQVVEELKKQYGFDKPVYMRYFIWIKNLVTLDFGYSHTFGRKVIDLIASKFPVSIRFGVASSLITYIICIPLGILKAVRDGSRFDHVSSLLIFLLYSVPAFMLAVLMIVFLAGGRYFEWFPMGGLSSLDSETWSSWARLKDQLWHMVLPLVCFVIGNFATLTILMKNSVIEEIGKDYVRTARSKGVGPRTLLFRHVLRNAMIPLATGAGTIVSVFFASNLLIEQIFNLDGFGKLFYDAALQRDYPVMLAQIVIGAVLTQLGMLTSDLTYVLVDPRISLE